MFLYKVVKAIPHNDRPMALRAVCLHIFRNLTQILLEIRQYSCVEFMQADEISDCAIPTRSLCSVALNKYVRFLTSSITSRNRYILYFNGERAFIAAVGIFFL